MTWCRRFLRWLRRVLAWLFPCLRRKVEPMADPVTVRDYWDRLRAAARQLSFKFGTDLRVVDQDVKVLAGITGAQTSVILKILVDKGVVTWAEIDAMFTDALNNQQWPKMRPPVAEDAPLQGPGPDTRPA